jgi:UDP-N-acetylmuramyl pentapeptide synthase
VLGRQGETHASAASYNNHWGVPLTLALMPHAAQFGVFEIGMNHAGEITPLVKLVRSHVAMVTTIAPVHLEFFGTVEAIAGRQGGDLSWRRAGRCRGHQSRHAAVRAAEVCRASRLHRSNCLVRGAREG